MGFPTIAALGCQLGFRYHSERPRGFAIATFQRGCFSFADHEEGNPLGMKKFEIKYDKQTLSQFCKDRGIRRLSLFGSALRDDYRPGQSDIDILAEFEPGALRGIGLEFFSYGEDLSKILGGKVDFCSKLNKHIRPLVEKECVPIYEQI